MNSKIIQKLTERVVTYDVETTTTAKGSPFNELNKLVMIQYKINDDAPVVLLPDEFHKVKPVLESASLVVGTNLKFDLHWLQRELGIKVKCVWDLQIAEFLFSNQQWKYPDLATMCDNYNVTRKLDVVKTEYWEKGIDTDMIPIEVLAEYGAGDVQSTYEVFQKQLAKFQTTHQGMFRLFRLQCNDLIVLQDMEFNGIVYDEQASLNAASDLDKQISNLEGKIKAYVGNYPLNLDSREHISVLLYGGKIIKDVRVPIGVYKTGNKAGQPRYKIVQQEYIFPRLVEPLKNSEMKKEGIFSTDESTLKTLKASAAVKKLIGWLLERSKIMKLKSTYLEGLPKTIKEQGWQPNTLHPSFNQCLATTGRLSSSKPNAQNLNPAAKKHCVSRF